MFQEFELLVASRDGEFRAPEEFQDRVHTLRLRGAHDQVSSTEVRERIARGEPWEHLVPEGIVERVREVYS
jgi:nicotinic acid mononucleotide adenylyltransferase